MSPEEQKQFDEYKALAESHNKQQGTCPRCGFCPTCGRPRDNWNFPQYPSYPWIYPSTPITPIYTYAGNSTNMPPATVNT